MELEYLDDEYSIYQFDCAEKIPIHELLRQGNFVSVSRSPAEISVVCTCQQGEEWTRSAVQSSSGWRLMRVVGTLSFDLKGILAELTGALADAGVSVFSVSTFDTDYLMVPQSDWKRASQGLENRGHHLKQWLP